MIRNGVATWPNGVPVIIVHYESRRTNFLLSQKPLRKKKRGKTKVSSSLHNACNLEEKKYKSGCVLLPWNLFRLVQQHFESGIILLDAYKLAEASNGFLWAIQTFLNYETRRSLCPSSLLHSSISPLCGLVLLENVTSIMVAEEQERKTSQNCLFCRKRYGCASVINHSCAGLSAGNDTTLKMTANHKSASVT